jgi:excinuclease UvrABC ATPase subunit
MNVMSVSIAHGRCEECEAQGVPVRTSVEGDLNSAYLCDACLSEPYTPTGE